LSGRELFKIADQDYIEVRRRIGFIFQGHNLFESLTALQNVRLAVELPGTAINSARAPHPTNKELDDRAIALLSDLGLRDKIHIKPHELSGGQRQRVAIARALAHEPELILADEPTAALDAESADIVVGLFQKQAKQHGRTIIVVTHDEKILKTADRIVQMKYGEILANIHVARATEICGFLKGSVFLKELAPGTLTEMDLDIANRMFDEHACCGTTILRQGELGDKFYIIRRGEVSVLRDHGDGPREIARLREGNYFGEVGLVRNEPCNATVVAATDVDLFCLNKQDFDDVRGKRATFEQELDQVLRSRL
jgi:putative ABC transport system ATP-binding protein